MASRWRDGPRISEPEPPAESRGCARGLPRWMRLYLYGMHGVTLDVLLSSLQGLAKDRDPKLLGFSSPYLCIMHALTHFVLEKIYSQKSRFRGRPAVFQLIFFPSVYIGLQMLVSNISNISNISSISISLAEQVRLLSGTQLAVHYVLALYFSQVLHPGLSHLEYDPKCDPNRRCGLPGFARFAFFGMHGLLDEVFFTSLFHLVERSDRSLRGHTSLWSFLMYGSCSFAVEKLYLHLHFGRGWGAGRRLPVYVCLIYAWELSWGLALRQFHACSWDYSHYPHNFMGLITLLYLPGWVCLSLYQDVLSNVLLRIRRTAFEGNCASGENGEVNGRLEATKKQL
ncbi:transmembrane protein 229A [Cololabis saira]|uniref:transmembrane protein 229A n=1 Tax=Cololabis saira TaxID=129043 RepID=UPI002AD430D4|nr:transmembrane protein 229A [Cololabis saira]